MIKCQFFLVVNDSTFVYTGYEFYPLYGSLLTLKGDKDSKYTFDTRGVDSAYERGGDARRLAFQILVSLRVFWAKRHHI